MSRIKRVLWERKIVYEKATYLVNREQKRLELECQGKSIQEIDELLKEFPLSIDQVGRNNNRFKLQPKFKGQKNSKKVEIGRWFIE